MSRRAPVVRGSLAALLLALCAAGQQRITLDGTWEIRPEADQAAAFRAIRVPSAFETVLGTAFDGLARYRRVLPLPAVRTAKAFVEFEAVATHALVYCNGQQVAEHLGGWTPFRADISEALRWNGADVLEVVVDERVGHNTQGFLPIIQPHFGGIWQSVALHLGDDPRFDRHELHVFGHGDGKVRCITPIVPGVRSAATVRIELLDGERVVATQTRAQASGVHAPLQIDAPRLWRPGTPHLYTARLTLLHDRRVVDQIDVRFGCRSLRADGTRVMWNDEPLQLRGILHWGYSPPHLAPPTDLAHWRRQLEYFRSLGFNCVKCCLWIPPRGFYDLCDELGMLVWQEYPTWHPQMDQAHKQELLAEYTEFFQLDRRHPSVAFRSITCETGHGADLDVVKALFDACKAMVPDSLVVDDSSWIGWQRITDFWDEHPYGNNSWFPGRLEHFKRHIEQNGEKPLLLGECIAADTWVDRSAWLAQHGEQERWWRPLCWNAQADAERWLVHEFGQPTLDSLQPIATAFGMRNRKFQIEQLRLKMPDAGYVVSVARDFKKARMGLYDDLDRPKWQAEDWSWHGDTMLCLDLPWNGRALSPQAADVTLRVAHFGRGKLDGTLRIRCEQIGIDWQQPITAEPGSVSDAITFPVTSGRGELERVRVHAELSGSHPAENHWDLWLVPRWNYRGFGELIEADALTPELIDQLVQGARVFLRVVDKPGALRSEAMWFLKGAPFAPDHAVHRSLSRDCLLSMSSFDLESGRVMPWGPWRDQVDPVLAFWETHDIDEVRFHLHAFDTRVGKGRLLATTLAIDGPLHSLPFHVGYQLRNHLAHGPAAQRALSPETIAALRAKLQAKTIDLPVWRFRTDPADHGLAGKWHDATTDVTTADWRDLQAGSHWENQSEDLRHYTGVAWYRIDVDVPADWRGKDARAVFDGVDDSFMCWLNGELVGTFGDPVTKQTIWLEQQICELATKLRPGDRNSIVLRVVDHNGAGGLWKPARLTTGPTGAAAGLLR